MKRLNLDIDKLPLEATRTEWSRILGCSVTTIDRAGLIGPAGYINQRSNCTTMIATNKKRSYIYRIRLERDWFAIYIS